jgi:hypothetical protein
MLYLSSQSSTVILVLNVWHSKFLCVVLPLAPHLLQYHLYHTIGLLVRICGSPQMSTIWLRILKSPITSITMPPRFGVTNGWFPFRGNPRFVFSLRHTRIADSMIVVSFCRLQSSVALLASDIRAISEMVILILDYLAQWGHRSCSIQFLADRCDGF